MSKALLVVAEGRTAFCRKEFIVSLAAGEQRRDSTGTTGMPTLVPSTVNPAGRSAVSKCVGFTHLTSSSALSNGAVSKNFV